MSEVAVGDTVEVLSNRNAFDQDISTWRSFPFKVGDTFVVAKVEHDESYKQPIVFPVGDTSEFWREDDLRVVVRANAMERIRAVREERGVGLLEARRIVGREDLLAEIDGLNNLSDVASVLRKLVAALP